MMLVVAEGFLPGIYIWGLGDGFSHRKVAILIGFRVKFRACKRRKDDDQPKKNAWVENPPHIIGDLTII